MITEITDDVYQSAIKLARTRGHLTISLLQRKLQVGFCAARKIVKRMQSDAILKPTDPTGKYYLEPKPK